MPKRSSARLVSASSRSARVVLVVLSLLGLAGIAFFLILWAGLSPKELGWVVWDTLRSPFEGLSQRTGWGFFVASFIGGLTGAGVVILAISLWPRKFKPRQGPQAESQTDSTVSAAQPTDTTPAEKSSKQDELKVLRETIERMEKQLFPESGGTGTTGGGKVLNSESVGVAAISDVEEVMRQVAQEFWEGTLPRGAVRARLARHPGLSLRRLGKLEERVGSTETYPFEETEAPEWLWAEIGGREALVFPLDAERLEIGPILELLQRLFEGLERMPAGSLRFLRAERACRLRQDPRWPGRYSRVAKGRLLLAGGSLSSTRAPAQRSAAVLDEPSQFEFASLRQVISEFGDRWLSELRRIIQDVVPRPMPALTEAVLREVLRQELAAWAACEVPSLASSVRGAPTAMVRTDDGGAAAAADLRDTKPPAPPSVEVEPRAMDADALRVRYTPLSRAIEPLTAALARETDPGGDAYLRRLGQLVHRLREEALPSWQIDLIHLQTTDGLDGAALTIHPTTVEDSKPLLRCGCGDLLHGTLLFQLAVRLGEKGSELSLVSLPPGPFTLSNFPRGYRLLVSGDPGSGPLTLVRVNAPAVVRCARSGVCEILSRLAGEFSR
jgi:hypothetical protein